MTGNTFYLWIGQHENGRYSKAHAHTSAAVLDLHQGQGLHLHLAGALGINPWKDGQTDKIKRVDYEPVGLVSAAPGGARWFHQHFGASKEPLRLTAWFGPHNPGREPGRPANSTSTTPRWIFPRAAAPSRIGWRTRSSRRNTTSGWSREGVENRMRPEYYDKNYKGELPKE